MKDKDHKIILFDGICNLCNSTINFVIKRDRKNKFKFATLQSKTGQALLSEFKIDRSETDSIVLIDGKKSYVKSTAALHIAKGLSGAFPLLFGLLILPRFIRDRLYDYVAKNRYKWFGKKESCMVPTPELKAKFLDD